MEKLQVLEVYIAGAGWRKVNKEMTVADIYLDLKSNRVESVCISLVGSEHGRDFSLTTFYNKYKREIIEGLLLRAEEQKEKAFASFRNRRMDLTSYSGIDSVDVEVYAEGLYFKIDAHCFTSLKVFMDNTGLVKRKPNKINVLQSEWMTVNC